MTRNLLKDVSPKLTRRLAAGEGYLELGMPRHALEELSQIDVHQLGELEASYHFFRGEALKGLKQNQAAIESLEIAARTMPQPFRSYAWQSLGECHQESSPQVLSELAFLLAKSPSPTILHWAPTQSVGTTPMLPPGTGESE